MKKLFFAVLCLLAAQFSNAQVLYLINNPSCTGDVYVVLYAENGTGCGPGMYYSDPILMPTYVSQAFDFSKPGMFFPWSTATGAPTSSTFNFVKAEIYNPATGAVPSTSTCTFLPADYYVLDNPGCGSATTATFEYSTTTGITPCPFCPSLCGTCPGTPVTLTATFNVPGTFSSAWSIDVN